MCLCVYNMHLMLAAPWQQRLDAQTAMCGTSCAILRHVIRVVSDGVVTCASAQTLSAAGCASPTRLANPPLSNVRPFFSSPHSSLLLRLFSPAASLPLCPPPRAVKLQLSRNPFSQQSARGQSIPFTTLLSFSLNKPLFCVY